MKIFQKSFRPTNTSGSCSVTVFWPPRSAIDDNLVPMKSMAFNDIVSQPLPTRRRPLVAGGHEKTRLLALERQVGELRLLAANQIQLPHETRCDEADLTPLVEVDECAGCLPSPASHLNATRHSKAVPFTSAFF